MRIPIYQILTFFAFISFSKEMYSYYLGLQIMKIHAPKQFTIVNAFHFIELHTALPIDGYRFDQNRIGLNNPNISIKCN